MNIKLRPRPSWSLFFDVSQPFSYKTGKYWLEINFFLSGSEKDQQSIIFVPESPGRYYHYCLLAVTGFVIQLSYQ